MSIYQFTAVLLIVLSAVGAGALWIGYSLWMLLVFLSLTLVVAQIIYFIFILSAAYAAKSVRTPKVTSSIPANGSFVKKSEG